MPASRPDQTGHADHADPFRARTTIETPLGQRTVWRLDALATLGEIESLPWSIKVLLESCLRHCGAGIVTKDDVVALASFSDEHIGQTEIPFTPGRVVLQDFTGVPAVVDLAAMRGAIVRMTGDPASAKRVNPLVQCDLVIDHSVQVDAFASGMALTINARKEFERNEERYEFLKWGQRAFDNFRVVPPATGIVHQVNLEYLARVVWEGGAGGGAGGGTAKAPALYPDSLVGTDSHTTMINGLGVVGWGVGGIEAEAVMLGQPIYMLIPEVVGFRMTGRLAEGCTATDLVLRVTEVLREHGVVNKFVEFHGPGLDDMPVANRATIANMAPEYGATIGFFPIDDQTLTYMRLTGRDEKLVQTVEQYAKLQGLWRDERPRRYTEELSLDLSTVEPSLAGPKRPQDRIELSAMKSQWRQDISITFGKSSPAPRDSTGNSWLSEGGGGGRAPAAAAVALAPDPGEQGVDVSLDGKRFKLRHGHVCIAAITSCTNTSNPDVMVAAGLVARKARALGLERKPWVKTSLAPGSKVVTEYLSKAKLLEDLEALGFYLVGYGCTTCIGNSGPLPEPIAAAITEHDVVACSVLSGNRNFEGRISPEIRANYLASPPLVVAYAIAGTVDVDLLREPLGTGSNGKPVFLRDVWPTQAEIDSVVSACVTREQFIEQYASVFEGSAEWKAIESSGGDLYDWSEESTYIQEPPFFTDLSLDVAPIRPVVGARVLCKLGDSVTTDHISPAGSIGADTPAGRFLIEHGVAKAMFNSYGSRRGNDRVMTRGTFANVRVRNQLAPGTEGGFTRYLGRPGTPAGDVMTIYDASVKYREAGVPLVVIAGKDYGMGSSRDWAAKGTYLLGVRAVIAVSFERIHRSNLVGMGVLPLTFREGENAASLNLDGTEVYDVAVDGKLAPRQAIEVKAKRADGSTVKFTTTCRIDTPVEVEYYRNGGILHTVLRTMAGR